MIPRQRSCAERYTGTPTLESREASEDYPTSPTDWPLVDSKCACGQKTLSSFFLQCLFLLTSYSQNNQPDHDNNERKRLLGAWQWQPRSCAPNACFPYRILLGQLPGEGVLRILLADALWSFLQRQSSGADGGVISDTVRGGERSWTRQQTTVMHPLPHSWTYWSIRWLRLAQFCHLDNCFGDRYFSCVSFVWKSISFRVFVFQKCVISAISLEFIPMQKMYFVLTTEFQSCPNMSLFTLFSVI